MLTGLVDGVMCGSGMVWRCRATRPILILKLEGTLLFRFKFSVWR